MSNVPATTDTSVIPPVATPPTPAATPPAVTPPTPPPVEPTADPQWLTSRLARERAKGASTALAAAGFATEADAKAAADAAKAAADSKKTAEQKAAELAGQHAAEKARADSLLAIATEHAARMMVGLTPEQQAAVKGIAGDDPGKQLQTIHALAPTWAKGAVPVVTDPKITTAPSGGAPTGVVPPPTDARGTYEALRKQNPVAAAQFGAAHPQVYTPKT
jgi:hypothetical protein